MLRRWVHVSEVRPGANAVMEVMLSIALQPHALE